MRIRIEFDELETFDIIRKEVYKSDNIGLHHLNDYMDYEMQMLCYALNDCYDNIDLDTLLDNLCNRALVKQLIKIGYKTYGSSRDCSTWRYTL